MTRQEFIDWLHAILDEQFIGEQTTFAVSVDDAKAVRDELNTELDKLTATIRRDDTPQEGEQPK